MGKLRFLDSAIWSQTAGWTTAQKATLAYLTSHPEGSLCGCFAVHPGVLAAHVALVGGETEAIAVLGTLRPRVHWHPAGWVYLPRYQFEQRAREGKAGGCARKDWGMLPDDIRAWAQSIADMPTSDSLSIAYGKPTDSLPIAPDPFPCSLSPLPSPVPIPIPDHASHGATVETTADADDKPLRKPRPENPEYEAAIRVHQSTLCTVGHDVPPREAYRAKALHAEVLIVKAHFSTYTEERLSRVAEGALLDEWTAQKRAFSIRWLFSTANVRKFIDLAENGVPSKVGNLL